MEIGMIIFLIGIIGHCTYFIDSRIFSGNSGKNLTDPTGIKQNLTGKKKSTLTAPSSSSASVFIISRNFHACLRFRVWLKYVGGKLPAEHSFHMMGSSSSTDYGHPERAFFKNLELLGLGKHFGLKLFVAFGVFLS